jgi:molybdopterin molybdotransferase
MITVPEALQLVLANAKRYPSETVGIEDALGRVLAENVLADRDYPPFNRAAMDGYAFRFQDWENGVRQFHIAETLFAGHAYRGEIPEGSCIKIMTGAATPAPLDCIIQLELAKQEGDSVAFPEATPKHWNNIAKQGDDCKATDIVLKKGTRLSPPDIGILAVLGKKNTQVMALPKVAIISTGNELVPLGMPANLVQIRDSNTYALQALFKAWGIVVSQKIMAKDEPAHLAKAVKEVLDFDIVVLSGGVSMGDADYVPKILAENEVEKIFHKAKLRPGKPIWFGLSPYKGAVFGLPGNPLSCQVCFKLFIEPYLATCFGLPILQEQYPLALSRKKKVKLDEIFPVKLEGGKLHPILFNGSGDVTSTLGSTGIAQHSIEKEDLETGEVVNYWKW